MTKTEFVPVTEISRRTGLSRPTVYAWLLSGRMPGRSTHFGRMRVQRETFENWLEKHRSVK